MAQCRSVTSASGFWWRAGGLVKPHVALMELLRAVFACNRIAWYVAPTYTQAKRIAWKRLKELTQEAAAGLWPQGV